MSRDELVVDERGGGEERPVRERRAVVVVVAARIRRGRRLIEAVGHRALQIGREPADAGRRGRRLTEVERDFRLDPLLRGEQALADFVGRRGIESRITAEVPPEFRERSIEADRGLHLSELAVQPVDLRQAETVDFLGHHVEGRVKTDETLVVRSSAGVLREADGRGRFRRIVSGDVRGKRFERGVDPRRDQSFDALREGAAILIRLLLQTPGRNEEEAVRGFGDRGAVGLGDGRDLGLRQPDAPPRLRPQLFLHLANERGISG